MAYKVIIKPEKEDFEIIKKEVIKQKLFEYEIKENEIILSSNNLNTLPLFQIFLDKIEKKLDKICNNES